MRSVPRFSEQLQQEAQPIWKAIFEHPFLQAIKDGSLPLEAFRYYLTQDYLYLEGFARTVASEGDLDGSIKILNFANEKFPDEERVLFALARVHQQREENDQAIMFLRRLVQLFPDSSFYLKELMSAQDISSE